MKSALKQAARVGLVMMTVVSLNGATPQAQGQGRGRSGRQDGPPTAGAVRGQDAARAIREKHAREGKPAADADALARVLEADESAWATPEGQVFFADLALEDAPETVAANEPAPVGVPPTPIGYTAAGIPVHHSKPGAVFKLYLDFDGDLVRSRDWGFTNRIMAGFNIGGTSPSSFDLEEQDVISRVWGRVAEDFAPFNIDVTTERPIELGNAGESNVQWLIFTTSQSAGFGTNVAGVSLFSLGYIPFGTATPAFVFFNVTGPRNYADLADTASHEAGHMFGLLHDGLRVGFEYYPGHGTGFTSWAPLMGSSINKNVTQWSRADYLDGGNLLNGTINPDFDHQDDIAIIAGRLTFRSDDVGEEPAAAAPFTLASRHFINSSGDVDVFALPNARRVELFLSGYRDGGNTDGGNLDIAAEIVNAAGLVVASVDDFEQTTATLNADLPPGRHFLRVHSGSNPANYPTYGSIGEYTITGSIEMIALPFSGFAAPLPAEVMKAGRTVPVKFSLANAPAGTTAVAELWSNASLSGSPIVSEACASQGTNGFHCNLKLPKTLTAGQTYWIAARYVDGGMLILPSGGTNPLAFVAK